MPRFNYVALDSRGQEASGVIEADSQSEAVGHLRQAGFFPKAIAEEGKGGKMAKAVKAATRQAASPKKPSDNYPSVSRAKDGQGENPDDFHSANCDTDRRGSPPSAWIDCAGQAGARSGAEESDRQSWLKEFKGGHIF